MATPRTMAPNCCKECRFWILKERGFPEQEIAPRGRCRLFPNDASSTEGTQVLETSGDDWCGQGEQE